MSEEEAFRKLQELLELAQELKDSGHYSAEEIRDEISQRISE